VDPSAATLLALIEIPFPGIDPVAVQLPGGLALRWYGIAFMLAFTAGYLLLRYLARSGFVQISPDSAGDLLFLAILGVIVGGRLGYILFYDLTSFLERPAQIIRIWEGGLSFHGGLIGCIIGVWWFARQQKVPFLRVGDAVTMCAPPGIFLVRTANFINGELYGRVAGEGVPWAIRFPTDPTALRLLGADQARSMRERELIIQQAYETGRWEQVRDQVPLRHPSQLYEGLTEGILLGLIVWGVYHWNRRRGRDLAPGTYAGIFLVGYGVFRSFVELFRQPDRQFTSPDDPIGTVLGPLTMGQTLSLAMVIAGIYFLVRGLRRGAVPPGEPVPETSAPPRRPLAKK
jgi:phosphatidylglycerol---prolipoprotein diacylglyceryl transferase